MQGLHRTTLQHQIAFYLSLGRPIQTRLTYSLHLTNGIRHLSTQLLLALLQPPLLHIFPLLPQRNS